MNALILLLAACAPEPAPRGDCDPLQPERCALPWPSAFYLDEDPDTPSGWRLALGEESLPVDDEGVPVRPHHWDRRDGFSTLTPILAWLPSPTPDALWGPQEIGRYLDADAPVLLLDAETGERAPIWVELDGRAEEDRLLVIRPAQPLKHATRYIVAIHESMDPSAKASEAFRVLRDGLRAETWDVEQRRERFEDQLFPRVEEAGLPRGELLLAWDFVTASAEGSLADALLLMDDALSDLPPEGPPYTLDSVTPGDCEVGPIGLTVEGRFTAPRYTEQDGPGTLLARDAEGLPVRAGETQVPFLLRVPCSLTEDPASGFLMQYGHGLLQDREELLQDYLGEMLDRFGWVGLSVDWIGLSGADLSAIAALFREDLSEFAQVPERSLQSFVNQELALRMALGALAEDPALVFDGQPLIDVERHGFYGISAGGVLGGAYAALSPSLERAALGVPGAPFSLLLPRSVNYDPFELLMKNRYRDERDLLILLAAFQTLWDPAEAAGWARVMNQEPLPGREPRQVLIQSGLGDAQVSVVGGEVLARAYGARAVSPPARETWGLELATAPFEGSALATWRYTDGSEDPDVAVPAARSGDTHLCVRREAPAQDQLQAFLEEGRVEQHCEGICEGTRAGLCD
ncbi:MAG: hypothetical protein H6740_13885 [Alphaproteobacteria bacterium]|nr:hypothetical protein [Alphaproteobacteria bacterium]